MIRQFLPLAVAAVALPAAAMAAPPPRLAEIVVAPVPVVAVPVAFTVAPAGLAGPVIPVALIRQIDALRQSMRVQMAALEHLAAAPFAMPRFVVPGGTTLVSMVSVGGPNDACSEQMEIVPAQSGRMLVFMRSRGKGCAPEAAALAHGALVPHVAPPRHAHRPPDALPPPSPVVQADYLVPGRARATG